MRLQVSAPPRRVGLALDHSRVPVLEALQEFRRRGDVVHGPPGHKQGRGADPRVVEVVGEGVFASDVLSLNGLDDRRESQAITTEAEDLMADAVDAERHLAHPPEPEDVRRALARHPDAKGMLLITPTDWGTCADIAGVAEACHERDLPLIVDEAWGTHLPFHADLPAWGMDAGADVVVTSAHKMGGAIEQSSVFHLKGERVSADVLEQREDLLGTTSSSALVYLTLDGWRRQMVEQGRDLLGTAIARALRVREAVAGMPGLEVMGREVIGTGGAFDLDPLAITIDVRGWASPASRPATGCAPTATSTWARPTPPGSTPGSPTPMTTRPRRSWSTPCARSWTPPRRWSARRGWTYPRRRPWSSSRP
ncbi:hypothetical protein ACI79C_07135 [Geodermatophilus sp. SYSU D00697]